MSDPTDDLLHGPEWKGKLAWEEVFLHDTFPSAAMYPDSFWHRWENRVTSGQEEEQKRIAKLLEQYPGDDEMDQNAADEFSRSADVTNAMSAALVVALWSNMESLLKRLIGI